MRNEKTGRERVRNIFPILFLLTLVFVFFHEVFLAKNSLIVGGDLVHHFHLTKFILQELKFGHSLPLWNPYIYSGISNAPEIFYFVAYPPSYLLFLLPISMAFNYMVLVHFFLAGFFMYLLAKEWGLDRYSSLVSAVTFMFCGFFVTHIYTGHLGVVSSLVWLPLIFLLFERLIKKRTFTLALFLGGIIGLEMFSCYLGAIQYTIYIYGSLFLYLIFRFVIIFKKEHSYRELFKIFLLFIFATIVGFFLAAIYILPNYEISSLIHRAGGMGWKFATAYSFPPQNIIALLVPDFFGNPLYGNSYWGEWFYWEICGYIGILPLLLALVAVIILFRRNRYIPFLITLAFLAFFLALGRNSPLYKLFYYHFPLFNQLRCPGRIMILYQFSIALLAGFGTQFILNRISPVDKRKLFKLNRFLIIACILSIITLLFFRLGRAPLLSFGERMIVKYYHSSLHHTVDYYREQMYSAYALMIRGFYILTAFLIGSTALFILRAKEKITPKILKVGILGLILLDLGIFGMRFVTPVDTGQYLNENSALQFLKKDKGLYRVLPLENTGLYENMGEIYRISSLNGYHPYILRRYLEFVNIINKKSPSHMVSSSIHLTNYNSSLVNLLNTKYLLSAEKIESEKFRLVWDQDLKIYENKEFLPRAFIVYRAKVIKERDKIFEELTNPHFNPRDCVILEEEPPVGMSGNFPVPDESRMEFVDYSPNNFRLKADLKKEGLLVLSEIYYPGWKAYVDGKEEKIYQADYILRAIYLNPGKHDIRFVYDPLSFKVGTYISLITALFLLLVIIYRVVYRVRKGNFKNENFISDQ